MKNCILKSIKTKIFIAALVFAAFLSGCVKVTAPSEVRTLRIIATSDLHGKFMPWEYATDSKSDYGSLAQLSSAIKEYRTKDTLLFDAGDLIQDNNADIFIDMEDAHPMVQGLNALDYDVFTPGNHEYNFGMDVLKKTIDDLNCKVLTGNVYDENGAPIADGYTIINKNGVRVAVIGMVTPGIERWDKENLSGCAVTDALSETRKIISSIKGQYDVLIGVYHMGLDRDFDIENSGVNDILKKCPEFDLMISAHAHSLIEGKEINGVLTVQNKSMAQTMSVIDLELSKNGSGYKVTDRTSESVEIQKYKADPAIAELLSKYHEYARTDAAQVIGELVDGPLAPKNEIKEIPEAQIRDTALIDLINNVQLHYSGADVSAAALFTMNANLYPGEIKKSDTSLIYKHANTLYKLRMTGKQLKKYMESSAKYYNTFEPGDLTISFDEKMRGYLYDMFEGVNYEIDISKPKGKRIVNLTWPDGTPVKDDDEFVLAVNDYRANSALLSPGMIYKEGEDLPVLLEKDVRGDIGGVRELIGDYIKNVKGGTIRPECNDNWYLTGYSWDSDMREKAVTLINSGELSIPTSNDGRTPNVRAVTVDDI